MGARIIPFPGLRIASPCSRCGGLRRVTFDQMSEAQRRWAPMGSVFPCPDCGEGAEIIPLLRVPRHVSTADGARRIGQAFADANAGRESAEHFQRVLEEVNAALNAEDQQR